MKKVWKWIIGIVIGLVILAALVGGAILLRNGFHGAGNLASYPREWSDRGPGMMPFGGFGNHMRGPGMMYRGGFMPFGGFLGGLVSLGFLVLIVLGVIWLVRYLRTLKPLVETPAAAPAVAMSTCKKCGRPIQVDWNNCPYCGKKV